MIGGGGGLNEHYVILWGEGGKAEIVGDITRLVRDHN